MYCILYIVPLDLKLLQGCTVYFRKPARLCELFDIFLGKSVQYKYYSTDLLSIDLILRSLPTVGLNKFYKRYALLIYIYKSYFFIKRPVHVGNMGTGDKQQQTKSTGIINYTCIQTLAKTCYKDILFRKYILQFTLIHVTRSPPFI